MVVKDKRAHWSDATFLVGFAATLIVLVWISLDYLMPLVIALSTAVVLARPHEWLANKLGGRRVLSASLMSLAVVLVIMVPSVLISIRVIQEIVPFIDDAARLATTEAPRLWSRAQELIPQNLRETIDPGQLQRELGAQLGKLATLAAGVAASIPTQAAQWIIDASIALMALYVYFLRGPMLVHEIIEATPMERRYTRRLLDTMGAAVRTVLAASFITSVFQLFLGWIAFEIVGVPYALALAAVMAFVSFIFALIPILGSILVWGPVGVSLILQHRPVAGIFILAWGLLVLGSIDNVVKPLYTKEALKLSPLLVFVTLFGGIAAFGPIGALVGPLVAALSSAFLRIWTTEFLSDAEPLPHLERQAGKPSRPGLFQRLRRRHV